MYIKTEKSSLKGLYKSKKFDIILSVKGKAKKLIQDKKILKST